MDLELVNLDEPSETRQFEKGRFELYRVGPVTVGRATYEPGWRWSEHVAPTVGTASCQVEHVGLVLSGQAVAKLDDGTERLMKAGDFFYVPPGHDSWVVGEEPLCLPVRVPRLDDLRWNRRGALTASARPAAPCTSRATRTRADGGG